MSHWIIGDLQGCRDDFLRLLDTIAFDPAADTVWIAGDVVSRGPDSLGTLRAVRALGDRVDCVLGNHDLHLLAQAAGASPGRRDDLAAVIDAPDGPDLLGWLAARPLALYAEAFDTLVVHAGVHRDWTLDQTLALSDEATGALTGADRARLLGAMYGDTPDQWRDTLTGNERLRLIINCFTRMRFCRADGSLDLSAKGTPADAGDAVMPWFQVPGRRTADTRIAFGHWSQLGTVAWPQANVMGLDTGCVWGGALTALRLEDQQLAAVDCRMHRSPT